MPKIPVAALLLALPLGANLPAAAQTVIYTATASSSSVHLQRQCLVYGDFCGKPVTVAPAGKTVSKSAAVPRAVYEERKPLIERQCTRYGQFC